MGPKETKILVLDFSNTAKYRGGTDNTVYLLMCTASLLLFLKCFHWLSQSESSASDWLIFAFVRRFTLGLDLYSSLSLSDSYNDNSIHIPTEYADQFTVESLLKFFTFATSNHSIVLYMYIMLQATKHIFNK